MKKNFVLLALIAGLIPACKNSSGPANEKGAAEINTDTLEHHHETHAGHSMHVELNNGQKWNANAETTAGIKNMISLVETMPNNPTAEDYHSLKSSLQKEFDTIIQKCTMTGEAHNQLHNYLLPMKEMIEGLGSHSDEESKEVLANLTDHLGQYQNFFQ